MAKRVIPIQEPYAGQPWPLIVVAIYGHRVDDRTKASKVVNEILAEWPTYRLAIDSLGLHYDDSLCVDLRNDDKYTWLVNTSEPCGLVVRRVRTLLRWLMHFHTNGLPVTVSDLNSLTPKPTQYAVDTWSIFMEGRTDLVLSNDFALMEYCKWKNR